MLPSTPMRLAGLSLPLLRAGSHPCSYLPGRTASDLIVLDTAVDPTTYQSLMDHGFRRSGPLFYRPACPDCRACVPIRVPVDRFTPSRSQRRVRRRNSDIRVEIGPAQCDDQRRALYERYQAHQHDRTMRVTREEFEEFVCRSPIDTIEMSYWTDGRLLGIGLVDVCPRSLSSVYFYFEPAAARRSLGVFSGLCEIDECRRRGLPHWYLGFYVEGCGKMEYKNRFRPYELLSADGAWRSAV